MTYIVDLTCIMQILFLLAPKGPIHRPVIKLAMEAYDKAGKDHVHAAIRSSLSSLAPTGQDSVLDKIVELIELYSIEPNMVQELRAKIPDVERQLDDEW